MVGDTLLSSFSPPRVCQEPRPYAMKSSPTSAHSRSGHPGSSRILANSRILPSPKAFLRRYLALWLAVVSAWGSPFAMAQGTTAISYQGQLIENGKLITGIYDIEFSLWNSEQDSQLTNQVAGPLVIGGISVEKGGFGTLLNFGDVYGGQALWLELRLKPSTAAEFTAPALRPRQPLTPAPFALQAAHADRAREAERLGDSYPHSLALTNADNVFRGTFFGNGSGITNLATDRLPDQYTSAITLSNNASIFHGILSGNGSLIRLLNGSQLIAASVPPTALADQIIDRSKIQPGAVDETILAAASVGTTALQDDAVTTAKIANGAVDNAQLVHNSLSITTDNGLTGGATVTLGGTLNLSTTATPTNGPSTIVQRDPNGDFAARTLTLSGSMDLPVSSGPDVGTIRISGRRPSAWMVLTMPSLEAAGTFP
jgi:hypothetical protein